MATAFPHVRVPFCRTSAPPADELAEITAFVAGILDAANRLLREVDAYSSTPVPR